MKLSSPLGCGAVKPKRRGSHCKILSLFQSPLDAETTERVGDGKWKEGKTEREFSNSVRSERWSAGFRPEFRENTSVQGGGKGSGKGSPGAQGARSVQGRPQENGYDRGEGEI